MRSRPNILLLHCHDLGRFLHCYGVPTVRTPHLDRLAADGVLFRDVFCTAPQCSPSRASLFTGRYPQQNGVLGLTHGHFGWDLHEGETHIARALGDAGYATALIGVQHESRVLPDEQVAQRLGFDHVQTGGLAPVVAARTAERLGALAEDGRPFYLQVGFAEPHRMASSTEALGTRGFLADGMEADDALGTTVPDYLHDTPSAREEIAELQGSVRALDTGVGQILEALEDLGLAEDTVVLFTTDHGLALPRAKCTLYDPGLEVAVLLRVPGRPAWSGRDVDGLVSNVDLFPTLLDLAGVPVPDGVAGRSLTGMVEGREGGRTEVFGQMTYHDYYDPRRCVRTDRYKLVANFTTAPALMDSSGSWNRRTMPKSVKAANVGSQPPLELYDLRADPLELTNIAGTAPSEVVDGLLRSLLAWMRSVDDPLLEAAVTSPMHRETLSRLHAPEPAPSAPVVV